MSASRRRLAEDGFTLVEMIIAIAILAFVMGALAAATITSFKVISPTSNRLTASHDAQLVSLYLPMDVQSASGTGSSILTTANTTCSGVTNVLLLQWTPSEALATTHTFQAAYAVVLSGNSQYALVRYECVDGSTPTSTIVAHSLASASSALATYSTSTGTVTMQLTESNDNTTNPTFTYTVTAGTRS